MKNRELTTFYSHRLRQCNILVKMSLLRSSLCDQDEIQVKQTILYYKYQMYSFNQIIRSWQALKVSLGSQRDNEQVKNYVHKKSTCI